MGRLEKRRQLIQRRLKVAKAKKREVLREVRSRLGHKRNDSGKKRNKEAEKVLAPKNKPTKRSARESDSNQYRHKKKRTKLDSINEEANDLLLGVDAVKFGERVDAPPKLALNKKDWGSRGGSLECVKALQVKPKKIKDKKQDVHEATAAALQKQAIEGYRAQRRLKSGKKHAGRATLDSLRELVRKEEERQAAEGTSHKG
ncbi:hypothetical protein BSKO_00161 [Bryopsis sp. KO-2023]|nr:hypothetical protein BSKO_00161 [Bryopsis sp. KO-2023]